MKNIFSKIKNIFMKDQQSDRQAADSLVDDNIREEIKKAVMEQAAADTAGANAAAANTTGSTDAPNDNADSPNSNADSKIDSSANLKAAVPDSNVSAEEVEKAGEAPEPLDPIDRQINAIYGVLVEFYGSDKLVIKAGKLEALSYIRSEDREQRLIGLMRLVYENPTIVELPDKEHPEETLADIEDHISDIMARSTVENDIEKKVNDRMDKHQQEYVRDIRMQILKEEKKSGETPAEQEKREKLEAMEKVKLTKSVMELLRPSELNEIVGQERAVHALLSKLSSPYPQHLILYGPPGVGKTTAARLVLEVAKKRATSTFNEDAPFVETDGTTLRWDPRDITNPLLGSVHDPIYQGARRDLAETGVPEPKPGLVTDAHGGILFIDEIGEMDLMLQNKLLKVLEDKRAHFESSYYDPTDEKVPPYIKKLFDEGAPADFVLIGATTRDAGHINPALRSRCAEIYFEPLTPQHIKQIILNAAKKLQVHIDEETAAIISEYTIEGRKAINILADAYSLALERLENASKHNAIDSYLYDSENTATMLDKTAGHYKNADVNNAHLKEKSSSYKAQKSKTAIQAVITKEDIYQVAQVSRLTPYITRKASDTPEIGHIFGLGVAGFLGSVIEIEAVAFKAKEPGKGTIRFNDTAGSMAKDSVFNAASVARQLTGEDVHDYDLHINVIGGGNIDGPSAGTAITIAIASAITQRPIRQDTAITGEISLQGKVRPVGGVFEKAYGAKQAGVKHLLIPRENAKDIPSGHLGLEIHIIDTAQDALDLLLAKE